MNAGEVMNVLVQGAARRRRDSEATAEGDQQWLVPGKFIKLVGGLPVPQTDTGIRDEYSKARELNLSKELGKMAPYLR